MGKDMLISWLQYFGLTIEQNMQIPTLQYFWLALTIAALLWYTFITTFVAIKGVMDIKNMLAKLKEFSDENGNK